MVAWLARLLAALTWLHGQFTTWSNATRFDLKITGQVRSLEYHLNRLFDPDLSRIYIEDGAGGDLVFIFLENENNPVYLPGFLTKPGADFLVFVPYDIDTNVPAMADFLNRYKLPTKTYEFRFTGTPV
jgi:hypothetical protein